MAWSADGGTFYLAHSNAGLIHRYHYDIETGALGARQLFVATHEDGSMPDGAAMDADGCYWCATHGAGVLRRYNPGGRMVSELPPPVSQPTMCAFTGSDLADLVVTSAADKLTPSSCGSSPTPAGCSAFGPAFAAFPGPAARARMFRLRAPLMLLELGGGTAGVSSVTLFLRQHLR